MCVGIGAGGGMQPEACIDSNGHFTVFSSLFGGMLFGFSGLLL